MDINLEGREMQGEGVIMLKGCEKFITESHGFLRKQLSVIYLKGLRLGFIILLFR